MKSLYSKTGLIWSLSYLGIFFIGAIYTIAVLVLDTAHSEMSGLLQILITMPWSLLFSLLFGVPTWHDEFASSHFLYGVFVNLNLLPFALINAIILYFVGRLGSKKS